LWTSAFSDVPLFLGFMIFRKTKSFIFLCFPFILFSEFSHYKKFKFFYFIFWLLTIPSLLYAEKVEEDKAVIFIYIKLRFLSQTGLFFLFFDYVLFVSLFLTIQKLQFFCEPQPSLMSHFFFGFYDFSQDKSFHFFGCSPFILFPEFSHCKKLNFFYSWAFYNLRCILGLYLDHWVTFFFVFLFFATQKLKFFWVFCLYIFFFNTSWVISMDYIFIFVQSLWVRHFQLWFSNIWHALLSHICHPLFIWSDDWI